MRRLIQTELEPGNCWQTAIACVLDVDPEQLPTQRFYDWCLGEKRGPTYHGFIRNYLRKHHRLAYVEIDPVFRPIIRLVEPGIHLMSGKTMRSATNGGRTHIVVAQHGEMIWDPHPSRAGLIGDTRWFAFAPFPPDWDATWDRFDDGCQCPACGTPAPVPEGATFIR